MKGAPLRTCAASLRINAGGGLTGRQLILGGGKEMSAQQGTGTNTYVEVVPLTLHIGAEIRGVDLSKPLPPEQVKEVRDAFLKCKVVFFRGQNLDRAQHVAMPRQFGEPTIGHAVFSDVEGHPEIYSLVRIGVVNDTSDKQ